MMYEANKTDRDAPVDRKDFLSILTKQLNWASVNTLKK
jgi:hypothetical protein